VGFLSPPDDDGGNEVFRGFNKSPHLAQLRRCNCAKWGEDERQYRLAGMIKRALIRAAP